MEKIKINSIEKKVSKMGQPFWVVKYNENGNATIGAWDAQFADYIEKDVGIGGTVSVVITQKGEYTNITEVDTTSGVKGECPNAQSETVVKQPTDREKSIVAQCLTKVVHQKQETYAPEEVLKTYNFFLEKL